jgi:hypothetical protein
MLRAQLRRKASHKQLCLNRTRKTERSKERRPRNTAAANRYFEAVGGGWVHPMHEAAAEPGNPQLHLSRQLVTGGARSCSLIRCQNESVTLNVPTSHVPRITNLDELIPAPYLGAEMNGEMAHRQI